MSLLFDSKKDTAVKGKWNPIIRNREKQGIENIAKRPADAPAVSKGGHRTQKRYHSITSCVAKKKAVKIVKKQVVVAVPAVMPEKINEQIGFKI